MNDTPIAIGCTLFACTAFSDESCHTHEWVMSHTWMSYFTHMNESCHTYEWVMSHKRMSDRNPLFASTVFSDESCHTYECVMSHTWLSHVTHMNESCHTHEWVMSHTWTSHITHRNTSCHTHECVMSGIWMHQSHLYMRHVTHINVNVTHMSHVWTTHEWHVQQIVYMQFDMCVRPTQSIMYDPLQVNRFQKNILLIVQYKYLNHVPEIFILQNLILRTRSCGTGCITQSSWVFHFHQTTLVWWKYFVPQLYQFRRGISGGPALKYLYMIHRGGRIRTSIVKCMN